MEFKDLYLNQKFKLENFNFNKEELELFTMAQIYGKDLSKMPYDFIKEKGLYNVLKTFNKINAALKMYDALQEDICSLISEQGELDLYNKESFDLLAGKLFVGKWTIKTFLKNLNLNKDDKVKICQANVVEKVRWQYDYDFEYEGLYFKNKEYTTDEFLMEKENPLFDKLFIKWKEIELSDEEQEKIKAWEERMKKYEEVKDMVDHAPEKPSLNYVYCEYVKPTKHYLELKELYENEILSKEDSNEDFIEFLEEDFKEE